MATYFVSNGTIDGAPNNANDGLDALGIELSSAAYDDEGHIDGDHRVFSGSSFGGYTWASGDRIYLTGTVITDGLYEVASKVDDDAILLATSAGGDDTVDSSDGPWATIQHGVDNAEAGDDLVICGASDYDLSSAIDFDTNATTIANPLWISGATARGVVDNSTRATIDFDNQTSGNGFHLDPSSGVALGVVFSNLNILNAYTHGVFVDTSGSAVTLNNCRVSGCGSSGVQLDTTSTATIIGCEVDNNNNGLYCSSGYRGPFAVRGSSIHDNTGEGVRFAFGTDSFVNTRIYNNGGNGASRVASTPDQTHTSATFANCTFFENGDAGIDFVDATSARSNIVDCVFRSNDTYAIDLAGNAGNASIVSHCCFSNNGSGPSDVDFVDGGGNIYVDPEFVSETGGSEDFEPDTGSPLIGAGCGWAFSEGGTQHLDIGAIQRGAS